MSNMEAKSFWVNVFPIRVRYCADSFSLFLFSVLMVLDCTGEAFDSIFV